MKFLLAIRLILIRKRIIIITCILCANQQEDHADDIRLKKIENLIQVRVGLSMLGQCMFVLWGERGQKGSKA